MFRISVFIYHTNPTFLIIKYIIYKLTVCTGFI